MALRVYGNRPLKTLPGLETRPTPSRVREAVFNIWCDRVGGCRWLDLCAGIGAMGAEALGRGAQVVVGIEQSKAACRIVTDNWRRIAPPDCTVQVIRGDVRRVINQAAKSYPPFDRIYFDPPYASDLYLPVLVQVEALCLLDLSGQMAAEHSPHLKLPDRIAGLLAVDRRVYGQTALTFYERES